MGLDIAHILTTKYNYNQLSLTINDFDPGTLNEFTIGPEDDGYPIQEGGKGGKTLKFSAGQVDNDNLVNKACMSIHSGGWWFDDCGTALYFRQIIIISLCFA